MSGFSLDKEGFLLVRHETKMKDFYDDAEVKRVYYPEIEQLVKQCNRSDARFGFRSHVAGGE